MTISMGGGILPQIPLELPKRIQDLPPKWAHLALEVSDFSHDIISGELFGKGVLIGVSGGVDSLCLLLIFKALQQKFNLSLEVAHLNHGFRPSAQEEAEWVEKFCNKLDVPCNIEHAGLYKETVSTANIGLEEKGRNWRYAFFERTRVQKELDYTALAHNLNDLAEDQIMRMSRGCGWPELGGMPAYDPKRSLIRPILMQPRKLLQNMLDELNVPFIVDESNSSALFMRNRVRMNIIPQLISENRGYLEHAGNLWLMARKEQAFWDRYLNCFNPEARGEEIVLPFAAILEEEDAARLKIFRKCLEKLADLCSLPQIFTPSAQLFEINRAIARRKSGRGSGIMKIQFPGGVEAVVGKAEIVFCRSSVASH